jgi:uncharacterized short protein YbdD (DUF466 family)
MICLCWPPAPDRAAWRRRAATTARVILGVPDYDSYVLHMQANHPGVPLLACESFLADRQAARFGGGAGLRCC